MLASLLGGFIVILVGVTLIPEVADQVSEALYTNTSNGATTNVTGASATIIDLTTIFFALGIMSAGVALAVNGLRNAGMI